MNHGFKRYLLELTTASNCHEKEVIQSLWSGYGQISRFELSGSIIKTVVVKRIALEQSHQHPRGWNTDVGHNRKMKSYEIETQWYENWAQQCTADCRIPSFLGTYSEGRNQWIILEDLDVNYPVRKHHLSFSEVKVCLKWLARFHMTFLSKEPKGLWPIGTYWHLGTRPDEFELIENKVLKSKAHLIDDLLNQARFKTIVHGDAKVANFCFSEDGKQVAAVDFQYVGGGCGMKDVAYLLGSCLTSDECTMYQDELLNYYFGELQIAFKSSDFSFEFADLEQEWRSLYPIACTDFIRFLLGWMPSHQKVNDYHLNIMNSVLART